ncbi:MAG TPA: M48 family metalloprotease [Candidatus Baltobacteraceae bacterium]
MTFAFLARATGVLALLFLCALPAYAGPVRPNALDARASALATQQLLSAPAATLVDPDRQIAAARYVRWRIPGFLLTFLVPIGLLTYFWRSGLAAALRDRMRARLAEFGVRFCMGAIVAAIAWIAALLPQFYLYRIERIMGISPQIWPSWALDWLGTFAVAVVATGVVAAVVLWLADRTHQWYLYTMLAVVVGEVLYAYVAPASVAPRYHDFRAPRAAIAARLQALETKAAVSGVPIVVADRSRQSPTDDAFVVGAGPSQRIVLTDSLVRAGTPGEIAFLTARAIEHVVDEDQVRRALVAALLVIIGMALAVTLADRVGFRRDDDPVSRLALVGALLGCTYLVALPVYQSYLRSGEGRVDMAAVALTGDRASAVRAMIRRADERLEPLCPNTLTMLYFQRTPPIAVRVAAFNGTPANCR